MRLYLFKTSSYSFLLINKERTQKNILIKSVVTFTF